MICTIKKYNNKKRDNVTPIEKENERDENYCPDNPQIDLLRTKDNYHTVCPNGGYMEFIKERISQLPLKRKVRSDAVLMCSFIIGSDGEFFKGLTFSERRKFFEECTDYFAKRYGKENIISAVVHEDETTPHLHLNLMPITNDKLSAKQLFTRTSLRELQTDFYEKIGKRWELERGKEGSQAKHIDTAEFKAKTILERAKKQADETKRKAERIEQENLPYAEALEQAGQGKFSKSKSGLKEQVIAVTADNTRYRNENKDLLSRLDVSMGEALQYAKRADKLEAENAEKSEAVRLLDKLKRENPEAYNALFETKKPSSRSSQNWWTK